MEKPSVLIENYNARVIYVRFKGSYTAFRKNSRKMFNQLLSFAIANNLIIQGDGHVEISAQEYESAWQYM